MDREKNADSYVGLLNLPRFKEAVEAKLGRCDFLFIDRICLRDTLAQCGLTPGAFLYCRRITQAGLWAGDPENSPRQGRPNRQDRLGSIGSQLTITSASIHLSGLI